VRSHLIASTLAGVLLCGTVAAQGLVLWHEEVVAGVCTFRFAVPEGWRAEASAPAPGAVSIRLTPLSGPLAKVLLTGTAPAGESALKSTGGIKTATRAMGEALLAGSVEKKLDLHRLDGTDGSGFFYTLTDRRTELPEGESRVMTQGIMAVGSLRLAVTALAQDKDSPAARTAFDLLRTAQCAAAGR
jgi:hypothetical protein